MGEKSRKESIFFKTSWMGIEEGWGREKKDEREKMDEEKEKIGWGFKECE